ncbi:TRAP transporter substrate-binding protein [Epibacterium ulvae]|uniref:TRAP transporter substrate-binding protein n=1 Tax=Epibacterium ulvae TaxID=1156985 RepID=UPI001BFCBC7F|nr:TRAP transporter substrate-binding protein [Epibacterium ulvae]MBT8154644.1 TRAP transporter substrate-binding protein [Epibacterium ulvae]
MKNVAIGALLGLSMMTSASADELALAYFMGPKHPMNSGYFTPMGEMLETESGGALTVKQFPGGALNQSPPKQYTLLLDGVADMAFMLPSFTNTLFPKTAVIGLPGICEDAIECTAAVTRARAELETEYNAKIIGLWANSPPVLITRDKPVRSVADLQGMTIRVADPTNIPFIEALGASPVAMPVSEINQALANGVVDGVMVDPAGIGSFKMNEAGNYITTDIPGGAASFVVAMAMSSYNALSDEEKAAVDRVAASDLSAGAGATYAKISTMGMELAASSGLEIIDIGDEERAKMQTLVDGVMSDVLSAPAGDKTVGDILSLMQGS